jgi:hypothetical protein
LPITPSRDGKISLAFNVATIGSNSDPNPQRIQIMNSSSSIGLPAPQRDRAKDFALCK